MYCKLLVLSPTPFAIKTAVPNPGKFVQLPFLKIIKYAQRFLEFALFNHNVINLNTCFIQYRGFSGALKKF